MGVVADLAAGVADGSVEVVDLTARLSERTPVLVLPPPLVNTPGFSLQELSRYDERGPAWYWNWFESGEHVGTHFDAPIHWITGLSSASQRAVAVSIPGVCGPRSSALRKARASSARASQPVR